MPTCGSMQSGHLWASQALELLNPGWRKLCSRLTSAGRPELDAAPLVCALHADAALTGGIVGVGIKMYNPPRENALVEPAEEAENFPITGSVAAFWGGSLIGAGLYLAAPGALRVAMMYGGS